MERLSRSGSARLHSVQAPFDGPIGSTGLFSTTQFRPFSSFIPCLAAARVTASQNGSGQGLGVSFQALALFSLNVLGITTFSLQAFAQWRAKACLWSWLH